MVTFLLESGAEYSGWWDGGTELRAIERAGTQLASLDKVGWMRHNCELRYELIRGACLRSLLARECC